ncbi:MAG: energy coupling factor transporter S component ThiW [Promethearchaeia archaeon]
MNEKSKENEKSHEKSLEGKKSMTKKVAVTGIFIAVGLIMSYLNPFAYFFIFGTKINPFAHIINAMMGVWIGLIFSVITASGIASVRFSLGIGTIHAFHGGISGAIVVSLTAYLLRKKFPENVSFAALTEPIGTIFIGGTIANLIVPLGGINGLLFYWGLFAASSIPGAIIGFIILQILKQGGISWHSF